jgi:glutamine---fructose-6-phosphate transaminase (isomerizing)
MSELASAIQAEPAAVEAMLSLDLADAVQRLEAARRLWLVGTGTSQHAAELGALMFGPGAREVGWRSSAAFAAQELGDGLGRDDGMIVISHTGETSLARRARSVALGAGAQVVSVTAQGSDWPEAIQTVPRERSETYTGSYLAALVVLARLSIGLGQSTLDERSLAEVPDAIRGALARTPDDLHLADARSVVFAGVGPGAITAREAALKLREAARVLAEGYEAEYLLHGYAVPLDGRDTLIAIQPKRDRFGLLDGLLRAASAEGVTVATIEEPDGLHPILAQFPLTVRAQLLADRTARARGQNPDTVITGAWNDEALWQAGAPGA